MKRRTLTLIEVLVGLALAAIVISFSLGYLRQLSTSNLKSKILKREVLAREIAFIKLSQVFSQMDHTVYPMRTQRHSEATKEALVFSFEQDQPDPHLSQYLNAELYLNRRNEVRLEVFGANGVRQNDIILDKVADLSFAFFCSEEKRWLSEWPLEKKLLPSLLKITILPQGRDAIAHTFPFVLAYGKDGMVSCKSGIKK